MFGNILGLCIFVFMFFVGVSGMVWSVSSHDKEKNNWGTFYISALIALISFIFLCVEAYELDTLKRNGLSNAYEVYRAYDDEKFSDDELDVIEIYMEDAEFLATLKRGNLSDRDLKSYESFVNDTIDLVDGTEGNIGFKEYVLVKRESVNFMKLRDVSKTERRKTDLFKFAEDVLGVKDMSYEDILNMLGNDYGEYRKLLAEEDEANKIKEEEKLGTFEIKK